MRSFYLGILFVFASSTGAAAITDCGIQACKYVRAGAAGNGSDWANAYGSLPSPLIRGTTYFIADGSYPGYTFNAAVSGTTMITVKKAIENDHGTNVGWLAEYGDGQAAFMRGFIFTSSNYIIDGQTGGGAENLWLGNFGFKITEAADDSAIIDIASSGTADNITIRHVALQGKGSVSNSGGSWSNDALAIYGASNITLSYFHMKGIGRCPFFISPRNLVVEHGWVESFYGSSAVHSEVASIWAFDGAVGDVTFRNNLFTDIQSTGGIMWDNSSNTSAKLLVYGNVFYKRPGSSWGEANGVIGGWTGGGGEQFHNAKVYNNSFINVDQASLSTNPNIYSNNEAYNNIFYNSDAPSFAKFASHDFNTFINSGGVQGEPNGQSYTTSSSIFVNLSALDFQLLAATPAGKVFAAPFDIDPLGKARGGDGVYDRGAFEFGSGGVAPPPPPPPDPTPEPLAVPTNLRLVSVSSSQVQMAFDYTGSSQTGFIMSKKVGAGSYADISPALAASARSYSDLSVAASTAYCYQVRAINSSEASAKSNELCVNTPAAVVASGQTLLTSQIPASMSNSDGANVNYELGMRFKATVAGKITHIRFYKSPSETGSHVGKIYSSNGSLLASVTFSGETASGWQEMKLPTPLSIKANTEYTVSVNTGQSYYVVTVQGMASQISNGNLKSVVGSNGVYGPVGRRPTSSWNNSNYFRDIRFVPN